MVDFQDLLNQQREFDRRKLLGKLNELGTNPPSIKKSLFEEDDAFGGNENNRRVHEEKLGYAGLKTEPVQTVNLNPDYKTLADTQNQVSANAEAATSVPEKNEAPQPSTTQVAPVQAPKALTKAEQKKADKEAAKKVAPTWKP